MDTLVDIMSSNKTTISFPILSKLDWLKPLAELQKESGVRFGRSISESLDAIRRSGKSIRLSVRNKELAVVIPTAQYEEMLELKSKHEVLLRELQELKLQDAESEFDMMYAKLTSNESRLAADALFSASCDEIGAAYQPGNTEAK